MSLIALITFLILSFTLKASPRRPFLIPPTLAPPPRTTAWTSWGAASWTPSWVCAVSWPPAEPVFLSPQTGNHAPSARLASGWHPTLTYQFADGNTERSAVTEVARWLLEHPAPAPAIIPPPAILPRAARARARIPLPRAPTITFVCPPTPAIVLPPTHVPAANLPLPTPPSSPPTTAPPLRRSAHLNSALVSFHSSAVQSASPSPIFPPNLHLLSAQSQSPSLSLQFCLPPDSSSHFLSLCPANHNPSRCSSFLVSADLPPVSEFFARLSSLASRRLAGSAGALHDTSRSSRSSVPPHAPTWFLPSSLSHLPSDSSPAPVLNLDAAGKPLTFRSAISGPFGPQWAIGDGEELVKLVETTHTLTPVHVTSSPLTYYNSVVKEKWSPASLLLPGHQRSLLYDVNRRVRRTAVGDRLPSSCPPSTPTASLIALNCLLNSVVSDNARFGSIDLTDFYLGIPLTPKQFIKNYIDTYPPQVLLRLSLAPFIRFDAHGKQFVNFRIDQTMYGLKKSGQLSQRLLISLLLQSGFVESATPCLFRHLTRLIAFVLVVDVFRYQVHRSRRLRLPCLRLVSPLSCQGPPDRRQVPRLHHPPRPRPNAPSPSPTPDTLMRSSNVSVPLASNQPPPLPFTSRRTTAPSLPSVHFRPVPPRYTGLIQRTTNSHRLFVVLWPVYRREDPDRHLQPRELPIPRHRPHHGRARPFAGLCFGSPQWVEDFPPL